VDPLIVAAITAFGVIASAYLTNQVSNRKLKSDTGQQMIDQHQEEIQSLRAENSELRKTRRRQDDYIDALRKHISDGKPPPPPPWPETLVA
jgi:Skp family chaperone for outer membrane proteins